MTMATEALDATTFGASLNDVGKATSSSLLQVLPTRAADLWRTDHNGNVVALDGQLLRNAPARREMRAK
jgi:hypothetical protein